MSRNIEETGLCKNRSGDDYSAKQLDWSYRKNALARIDKRISRLVDTEDEDYETGDEGLKRQRELAARRRDFLKKREERLRNQKMRLMKFNEKVKVPFERSISINTFSDVGKNLKKKLALFTESIVSGDDEADEYHSDAENTWSTVEATSYAKLTINPIRKIVEEMKKERNPEKKMISLSIGDPTVYGNFDPPKEAINAVQKALLEKKGNGYLPSNGLLKARQAVAKHLACNEIYLEEKKIKLNRVEYKDDDIILTSGCSQALELCISVLMEHDTNHLNRNRSSSSSSDDNFTTDNILIPRPGFSLYKTLAHSLKIETRSYALNSYENWHADLHHMESLIDERTKAILLLNPSNPCGSNYNLEHLQNILKIAQRHHLVVIADEIYANLVYNNEKFFFASQLTQSVPIMSCGGLGKRYMVPGWRLGWISIYDPIDVLSDVKVGLLALCQRILGPCALIQAALPDILENTPQSYHQNNIDKLSRSAKLAYELLCRNDVLEPVMPSGAMYMMVRINVDMLELVNGKEVNSRWFTEELIVEQSVMCLPGECFEYPNSFRIVLTVPVDDLRDACQRIDEFCKDHRRR
ncbi:hypothetical protein SNEBB_001034 [Seison nebaliae]|nr:hypothetical protein SNEBB_001034 [Seison nebaliae]